MMSSRVRTEKQDVGQISENDLGENLNIETHMGESLIRKKREYPNKFPIKRKNDGKRKKFKTSKKNQPRRKNPNAKKNRAQQQQETKKKKSSGKAKKSKGNRNTKNRQRKAKKPNGNRKSNYRPRKSKKPKRGPRKGNSPSCSRQTTSTFCPAEKATSLKLLYNQVYNFKKQLRRAQNHVKIVKRKKNKKDTFKKDAAILTDVVGGNLTAPSCTAASATRSGPKAASKASILASCSTTISTSCEEISINTTLTGSCSTTMTDFEEKVTACRESKTCTCCTEAVAMKSDITKCNALKESEGVKSKKKTCLKTFSE